MRLHNPPFLQIALDQIDKQEIIKVISSIPKSRQILIEAGTPLIKKFGSKMIEQIRSAHPSSYIVADMKTLDVGSIEVQIAAEASANASDTAFQVQLVSAYKQDPKDVQIGWCYASSIRLMDTIVICT